ncbi:MAG: amidohydrolase family protein [Anaerolineales bacterium]|jgi:predicted TIM-barrel fold metal-dependent hydrolase
MDLSNIAIIDHHTHALLREDGPFSLTAFQRFFTESDDPRIHANHAGQTLFFRWAIKELAVYFDCEPTPAAVLAARNRVPPNELGAEMFHDANLAVLLIDYGFGAHIHLSPDEMQARLPCRIERLLRLETMAQDLILENESYDKFLESFTARVENARSNGHIGLKSIIAYRTGLAIKEWDQDEARQAFLRARVQATQNGKVHLADKPLNDVLVLHALEIAERQRLPIQFHTGFGDPDVDLLLANPLHLRPLLQSGRFTNVPIVLLHASYPYTRELSYLATMYANVFMDISLAIPQVAADIPTLVRTSLSLAPTSKVLFSTDAYSIPEIFWIAARWGRWGIGDALDEWLKGGMISASEADEIAHQLLHGNAETIYGITV